jgi:hypothetical protein
MNVKEITMRIINLSKICGLVSTFLLTFSANVFAKDINLYDQPSPTAKVVGTIAQNSKMVPIFTDKSGEWMKIGDPTNGNVGWVKVSDFNTSGPQGTSSGFSMSQQTVNTPSGPQTYRTIQLQPSAQTNAQAELAIRQLQSQQLNAVANYQKMFNAAYQQMNDLYKNNPQAFGGFPPVVVPIIVMPQPTPVQAPVKPAN